ncbi:hypothetical protein NDU88_006266 [Pleurodeles waltl]|uniref:Transposase n=1 Tax=Pleurodeles waltl TaxID=8319 RepID=A0AAV7SPC8_PLEWA|nr:hypothetical protein NDU88_006266 [Pleurodeles waltl]
MRAFAAGTDADEAQQYWIGNPLYRSTIKQKGKDLKSVVNLLASFLRSGIKWQQLSEERFETVEREAESALNSAATCRLGRKKRSKEGAQRTIFKLLLNP